MNKDYIPVGRRSIPVAEYTFGVFFCKRLVPDRTVHVEADNIWDAEKVGRRLLCPARSGLEYVKLITRMPNPRHFMLRPEYAKQFIDAEDKMKFLVGITGYNSTDQRLPILRKEIEEYITEELSVNGTHEKTENIYE